MKNTPPSIQEILHSGHYKRGFLKCRLMHLDGKSIIFPEILFCNNLRKHFYIPKFFDPNRIFFFENSNDDFAILRLTTDNNSNLSVLFYGKDKTTQCKHGALIYKCYYVVDTGSPAPQPMGVWRRRKTQLQLQLFHHTNPEGYKGITSSNELWGSRRNIQGNLWLKNIAYGYLTCLPSIRNELDLLRIAMSASGLTGLIPTNAPYHPIYAKMIRVPTQNAIDRSHSLRFWVDCELLAPNHLWFHQPMGSFPYYEVVLPSVFRVGIKPDKTIPLSHGSLSLQEIDCKVLPYVIVGHAGSHEGLAAPYNEEETTSVAKVHAISDDEDIISTWKQAANSDQFTARQVELLEIQHPTPRTQI